MSNYKWNAEIIIRREKAAGSHDDIRHDRHENMSIVDCCHHSVHTMQCKACYFARFYTLQKRDIIGWLENSNETKIQNHPLLPVVTASVTASVVNCFGKDESLGASSAWYA